MTLKGFPKNLVRYPQNAEEFTLCKRENNAYKCICAVPIVVAVVLTLLGLGESVGMILLVVGLLPLILLLYRMNQLKNSVGIQIADLTCPQCKSMIEYNDNVRYNVLNVSWSAHATKLPEKRGEENSPMHIIATGKQTAKVEIFCKCQKCGNEHSFIQDFCIGVCKKDQRNVAPHLADLIKAQFESEVNTVSKEVFSDGKDGNNSFGVTVTLYDLKESVADHFNV